MQTVVAKSSVLPGATRNQGQIRGRRGMIMEV